VGLFHTEALRNASEATKNFFEARVAVMGYKSRQLQLQGEVECLRAEIAKRNSGVVSSRCVLTSRKEGTLADAHDCTCTSNPFFWSV